MSQAKSVSAPRLAGEQSKALAELDLLLTRKEITDREYLSLQLSVTVRAMTTLLRQHVNFINPATAILVAFWIVNTYVFDAFEYAGYIHLRSTKPGSGKTTLLKVMARLSCGKPPVLTAPTAATIFRSATKILFFDEVEQLDGLVHGDGNTIIAVLNAGFEKCGAVTRQIKITGGDYSPSLFNVYGPKALAGLMSMDAALESRCFFILMKQATTRPRRFRQDQFEKDAAPIRARLEKWAKAAKPDMIRASELLADCFSDLEQFDFRFQDIAEPLYVLGRYADRHTLVSCTTLLLEAFQHCHDMRKPAKDAKKAIAW
jgi:hypothetical protein